MGAQTLEILRQGLWASLTGGWFYDPHQTVFCNIFHFYLWITLLCLPFSIYLYFPPSLPVYVCYCGSVTLLFVMVKTMNHALHRMFDTGVCYEESVPADELPESQRKRALNLPTTKTILEEEGIELQEMKSCERVALESLHEPTDDDSVNSFDTVTIRPTPSTIDLKVDVHRKNSSGSSEEARCAAEYVADRANKEGEEPAYVNLLGPSELPAEEVKMRRRGQHKCACLQKGESEPGKNYDMGITANGSCGVLPQMPPNLEQMKNTGSLELPINDYANVPNSEKGLLYWKAHHLEPTSCCDKLRKADNVMHLPSEVSIPSASCTYLPINPGESDPSHTEESKEDEQARKFLEEEFDWFQGEYSDRLPSSSGQLNSHIKFKSDDNILNEKMRGNQTMPCLKFQVNSDEDSSDNAGSKCPLLCRHDSLEKQRFASSETHTAKSCPSVKSSKPSLKVYQDTAKSTPDDLSGWVVSRPGNTKRESFLGNKKLSLPSKVTTPEDADEEVTFRRRPRDEGRLRRPELADVDHVRRRPKGSRGFEVADRRGREYRRLPPELADEIIRFNSGAGFKARRITRRADTEPVPRLRREYKPFRSRFRRSYTEPETQLTPERRNDVMTWSTERMGFDWLFEHTDSENDCSTACLWKFTHSEDSDSASHARRTVEPIAGPSQAPPSAPSWVQTGAIPKTVVTKRPHRQKAMRNKRHGTHVQALESEARREAKRLKNERENGIIDEEDTDSHVIWMPQQHLEGDKDDKTPEWRENRETYDSSSGSTTELSSLLPLSSLLSSLHPPSSPLLAAFLASRRDLPAPPLMPGIDDGSEVKPPRGEERSRTEGGRTRHQRSKHSDRSRRSSRSSRSGRSMVPLTSVVAMNTHIAQSHNDTSQGAVHCYQDEMGNWWSYTFDPSGTAGSTEPVLQERAPRGWNQNARYKPADGDSNLNLVSNSTSENESCMSISPRLPRAVVMAARRSSSNTAHTASSHSSSVLLSRGDSNNNANQLALSLARQRSLAAPETEDISRHPMLSFLTPPPPLTKNYYKFFFSPWHHVKIRFDRLQLIALLDRNLTLHENCLSLVLSMLVSFFGIMLLSYGFYRDLFAFVLCVTIAGCHYSLLKSVQPDAASPTHGFNRVVIYSRAVYFCLTSSAILGLTIMLEGEPQPQVTVYNIDVTSKDLLFLIRDILSTLLLFFPLFFTLGLFPQVNTFALYIFEQIDIHIFGGNAAPSLVAAVYSLSRSVFTIVLLFGFAYGALSEKKQSQHILFSIFATLVVIWSYHLSRSASDPSVLWNIVKDELKEKPKPIETGEPDRKADDFVDPLPNKLKQTVYGRLINDVIVCGFVAVVVLGIHCSAVFTTLQPDLNKILWIICGCCGMVIHYIIPQLRKQLPWLCLSRPVLRSHEHGKFEVLEAAKVMWFEEMVVVLCFLERNILYPVLVLAILTSDAPKISAKFGPMAGALVATVCGVKVMRAAFSHTAHQYLIVVFTALLLQLDYHAFSETFLVDFFFLNILFAKTYEFLLKVQFVVTYIAPWQITWGSAFHAFAQPFSVPHSAILFVQAAISALLSAPLNPFLGSAIFLISYVRPVKFWERDYNTKRVDQSNTRLSSHLDRNLGSDDNNLNSIFYEHLTRSLQHSLCGDLMMGRWGPVSQGDCFVLASDYLNCLVHIIEMGNGLITFQMRGLEFRGTYCQQREVEAISEGVEENEGCCCCVPGHIPNVLSVNAAFSQRWLAWEVMATKYVLEGYSISDNSAASMLQVFDFRKVLVTYYVKGIIWYCLRSPRLEDWLTSRAITAALASVSDRTFVDLDPVFNVNIDQDFDFRAEGITRSSFCNVYLDWIQFCVTKLEKSVDKSRESPLVSLCLALSLMGRRALGTASHNTVSSVEFFLYGLHALFKGDFRITSIRDEWVFSDMDLLKRVVAPAVRISLKLHQDHFMSPEEYEENSALYSAMEDHDANLVISHEGDPAWRGAVLSGTPSLLALRHVLDDGADEYKVIMLNKRYLSFRVIKLNRECVRGLWAGQQQELVFLRNRNPERGSIQNAKQALRNMINSSCDQPIGYPIFVSPLTTSYADTHEQLSSIIGGPVSLQTMKAAVIRLWKRIRHRCRQGCSSGSVSREDNHCSFGNDGQYAMTHLNTQSGYGHSTSGSQSMDSSQMQLGGSNRGGSLGRSSLSGRGSFPTTGKPSSSTLVSLAGLLTSTELTKGEGFLRERETSFTSIRERQTREDCCRRHEDRKPIDERREVREKSEEKEKRRDRREIDDGSLRVKIVDPKQVFDAINLGRRIDVLWPDEHMRSRGGRSYWKHWLPDTNMEGMVVHRWIPNHRDPGRRSHVDKTILLMKIGERYVPIAECGVEPVPNLPASVQPVSQPSSGVAVDQTSILPESETAAEIQD